MTTIEKVKVYQMTSPQTGKEVANQFVVHTPEGRYFQSYTSIIAFIPSGEGKIILDEYYWKYSATTSKYRSKFLGEDTKETQRKIDSGEYLLTNLN